ncbi:MAG: extracellular solute-binding protein [Candidatus Sumerlaeia bacterium]
MKHSALIYIVCILLVLVAGSAVAEEVFPKEGWKHEPNPLASPDAYPGGEVSIYGGPSMHSLNYLLDNNTFSAQVFGLMYETLLTDDPITLEERPFIARKWSISDDKKVFTFWIDPKAKWSDGKPITVEDVKWTYEQILKPENITGPFKVSLERIEKAEILAPDQIRFTAKEVHWKNLGAVSGMPILPKHTYQDMDFNLINFEFPVISGPYRLKENKSGMHISMERRKDWWYRAYPEAEGVYNFDIIKFKIFESAENAYEAFMKGEIDIYPVNTARLWVTETAGDKFQKNWIVKQKIYNYNPSGFQGFAMNMRKFPFDDVNVRKAIAYLVNREKMNETLMYNQYFMHKSYYEDLYGPGNPCPNPLIPFDKGKARELLAASGWKANPETGILEKDGKPLVINFLARSQSSMKFLNIFQQDLKDVGIDMKIDMKDWAAWTKDMMEFNYMITWAAWGGVVKKDAEGMWHSKEATRESGNNITGFQNEKVDAMIERTRTIFDINERHDIIREIDHIVYMDFPYALLWNLDYERLLYWNKFGVPRTVLSKYSDYSSAQAYWWADEDSELDLEDAQETGRSLPAHPYEVHFDKRFQEK